MVNNKMIEIEVSENKYLLGFPNRMAIYRAEDAGLNLNDAQNKLVKFVGKLFYTGLLAKQPHLTEEDASDLMDKYIEEGGNLEEITEFLTNQYVGFTKSLDGKATKKAKIITMK